MQVYPILLRNTNVALTALGGVAEGVTLLPPQ